jgi:ATP adenylyltransferase
LQRLWSPWRSAYLDSGGPDSSNIGCVFCYLRDHSEEDEGNYFLYRGAHNFVVLNLYPYISGHLMVVPYDHVSELDGASKDTSDEMMDLAKRSQTALRAAYNPEGFNLGMNLGKAAGAGIADHIHIHVMPRWAGDTNFMTTVAEARVLPEDLATTYQKLRARF